MRLLTNWLIGAAVAAIDVASAWAWADQSPEPYGYGHGPHMMGWYGGEYGMFLGPLFMIVTLALAIAVAVVLVRWLAGPWRWLPPSHPTQPGRTALDILKERFARGEIDKQEFEERRRVLGD